MSKIKQAGKATKQDKEIINITIEECCEVVQALTKILRFGWESVHPNDINGQTNREHLEEEIGDLLCLINLMSKTGMIDWANVDTAMVVKLEKLKKFSNIDPSLIYEVEDAM